METNHFALETKLYVNVLHSVFQILREFNFVQFSTQGELTTSFQYLSRLTLSNFLSVGKLKLPFLVWISDDIYIFVNFIKSCCRFIIAGVGYSIRRLQNYQLTTADLIQTSNFFVLTSV